MIGSAINYLLTNGKASGPVQVVADNFNGTSGASLSSRNSDSGDSWTVQSNTTVLFSGFVLTGGTVAASSVATVDKGWSNVVMKIRIDIAAGGTCGFVFRFVDINNYYRIEYEFNSGSGFRLIQVSGGVETTLKFRDHTGLNQGTITKPFDVELYLYGNKVTAYVGATVLDYTGLANTTSTIHGIYTKKLGTNTYGYIKDFVCYNNTSSVDWTNIEPPNKVNPVIIKTPSTLQVLQRNGTTANINIQGYYLQDGLTHTIQASFNGAPYTTIATSSNGYFSGTLTAQSQGQGTLLVKVLDTGDLATIQYVGIGDVIVLAGQSNMSGMGNTRTLYTTSGPKASKFANTYKWAEMVEYIDNIDGQVDAVSNDATGGAVYIERVATQFIADQNVPIAVIPCSLGGTSILSWAKGASSVDRNTLYGSMIYRALQQPNGVKFVLWHQGESDALSNAFLGYPAYKSNLKALADNIYSDIGVPIVVSRIHKYDAPFSTTQANVDAINLAMNDASVENSHVLLGPNYDSPTRVSSDIHFITAAEILDAGNRCWAALKTLFY